MENKFEKMDAWMMKASQTAREQKIPEKELETFHEGVMKKILVSQPSGWGMPYGGFLFAAGVSLAVILGAAFYIHQIPTAVLEEKPVKAEVTLVTPAVIPVLESKGEVPKVIVPVVQAPEGTKTEAKVQVTEFKEQELLEEIEALKELGVWTEEDEEEAGIPIEAAFLELGKYTENNQAKAVFVPSSRT